jgi:FKBP-type peptidyl-prolyl cis-trans isomerase
MDTMTNSVQDKVKADWEKAQQEGSQRINRIREIFQGAANEALSELKNGTLEVESLGRQSLAEMIEQLKAKEAAAAQEAAESADQTAASAPPVTPSWGDILAEVLNLANDRKANWTADVISHLQGQLERFDNDMGQTYGDRYRPLQPLVQGLRSLLGLAYQQVATRSQPASSNGPVTIEVLDDGPTTSDDPQE